MPRQLYLAELLGHLSTSTISCGSSAQPGPNDVSSTLLFEYVKTLALSCNSDERIYDVKVKSLLKSLRSIDLAGVDPRGKPF